ncbi:MAG: FkbM family methyltransferase [Cyclobacteriaceae bacterium]
MGLSKILNLEFNSAFLRYVLSRYYKPGRFYKIPFGELRGFRIWYDRTINYHAVLGIWEKSNFAVVSKLFSHLAKEHRSLVVYDIGANIGLFTLFFSKFKPSVRIVAFEAVEETVAALKTNLHRNSIHDVVIENRAVSSADGTVSFFVGHHHKSSLVKNWASDEGKREAREIKVPSIRIDSYVQANPTLKPDFIKIDVEGGADKVLEGVGKVFETFRPLVMIESHNAIEDNAIIQMLAKFDYDAFRINNRRWVKNKIVNYKDPGGVWGNMILIPVERSSQCSQYLK